MKVLLKRDVKGLGDVGEVKDVANGYASNYLIPRGLAVQATKGVLKAHQQVAKAQARKQEVEINEAQLLADKLDGVALTFSARAGESGKLYGSITSSDIASGIEMETGQAVDRRKVVLEHPIRELGKFQIPIRLAPDVIPEVTVVVEGEDE
jgi:large subunit ribosomal protein L9